MMHEKLGLASQSPRRSALLTQIGVAFDTLLFDYHEKLEPNESPDDAVVRLSHGKALSAYEGNPSYPHPLLAADTLVALNGEIFGKPPSAEDARRMLAALSGQTHQVYTAVVVTNGDRTEYRSTKTDITFTDLHPDVITRYVETGEPMDKAGAYAVQGIGGQFVRSVSGSYSAVVGLPLPETIELLHAFKILNFQSGSP